MNIAVKRPLPDKSKTPLARLAFNGMVTSQKTARGL